MKNPCDKREPRSAPVKRRRAGVAKFTILYLQRKDTYCVCQRAPTPSARYVLLGAGPTSARRLVGDARHDSSHLRAQLRARDELVQCIGAVPALLDQLDRGLHGVDDAGLEGQPARNVRDLAQEARDLVEAREARVQEVLE